MYYPLLRGKRFELLALREWAGQGRESPRIVPIIEPVRSGTLGSDLRRVATALAGSDVSFIVVVNPTVGELTSPEGQAAILEEVCAWEDSVRQRLSLALVCGEPGTQGAALGSIRANALTRSMPVIPLLPEDFEVRRIGDGDFAGGIPVLIGESTRTLRRLAATIQPSPGVARLSDPFPPAVRNADYVQSGERIFTDDHLYFRSEGQAGFADYMTIGKGFRDGGGSPNYVVIHWTYSKVEPRADGHPVYLQHFCSSDAELDYDTATKFQAAISRLLAFAETGEMVVTPALGLLQAHHEAGTFPGLGVLKKVSILNHLQVMESTPWPT